METVFECMLLTAKIFVVLVTKVTDVLLEPFFPLVELLVDLMEQPFPSSPFTVSLFGIEISAL